MPRPSSEAPALTVYERLTGNGANVSYPLCLVSIAGMMEQKERVGFGLWKWTYPVLALWSLRGSPTDPDSKVPYEAWRDQLITTLETTRELPGVDGFFDISAEPGGNVTGLGRGRTEPGQTSDPLGPAWLKVAGSVTVQVEVIREG